jgi:hypothetical protein
MITKKYKYISLSASLFLVLFCISGCGRLQGDFAFRNAGDEAYRKIEGVPEFEKSRKVNWVFVFKKVSNTHGVSAVLLKKELVWVDIESRLETISKNNKTIYGDIENLDEGTYKIMISEEGEVISEKEFIVFIDEDSGRE